jgi:glycerol-3-phosphate acyltransferase PlsY
LSGGQEAALAAAGLAGAYLLGSIPFGLLLGRRLAGRDVRALGSGNIGATNVLRSAGKLAGILTLLADALKGAAGYLLARALIPEPVAGEPLAAGSLCLSAALLLPVLGHCYPVWLGFRGGKGVATALGVGLAAWWPGALVCAAVFAATAAATRWVSLASLAAVAALPVAVALSPMQRGLLLPGALLLLLLVVLRHRSNIGRLLAGREPRLGERAGEGRA